MLWIKRCTEGATLKCVTTVLILFTAVVLVGCGGGDNASPSPPTPAQKTLSSIAVTPASPTVPLGLTQQLKATGTFSDGSTADLTTTVGWSSSNPSFATVNATTGLATSVSLGSTVITATSGSVSGTTTLTATPAALTSISITPNPASAWIGNTTVLAFTGTYSDGTTAALNLVPLTSSTPSVATLGSGPGYVTGVSLGSTTITATIGSVTATDVVTVLANPWSVTGSMTTNRFAHTATLLSDGTVLVAGGLYSPTGISQYAVASSEIYDPVSGAWTGTGSLNAARCAHTATLLTSGKVLVTGGGNLVEASGPILASTELYDRTSGTWTTAASLSTPRIGHTATLLPDGTVLVVGGIASQNETTPLLASAEIYDPATDTWTPTGSLITARSGHTATLLQNGTVLVAGGAPRAEIYDPATGTWTSTGSLITARAGHTATLLANGTVLVVGGTGTVQGPLSSAEIYDPGTGSWKATGSLATARSGNTATLLPDGTVLVAGGDDEPAGVAEIYDPVAGVWTLTASPGVGRLSPTATLLLNGTVLVAGGITYQGRLEPVLTLAEIYQ